MAHAIAFDTLASMKRLQEAGFTEKQAETQTRILAEMVDDRLATKQDLAELAREIKGELRELRLELMAEIKLNRWMLALVVAATVLPALKTLFG
ncbi:MAG: CCDC90 family protein [Magnetococcus sp. XQGC-1]